MAQEIVRLCDVCLADDVRANAQPLTVQLGGPARLLDLCDEHREQLIKPLAELLAEYGQPVPGQPTKRPYRRSTMPSPTAETAARADQPAASAALPGELAQTDEKEVCPFCQSGYRSAEALRKHLDNHHNTRAIYAAAGGECPICGVARPASGRYSLRAHIAAEHGLPTLSRAIDVARVGGDPFGVVARVLSSGTR